ncbi:efflux RND transporter periplasmic adaptor subunit [Lysobacter sp. S4-A87]|uniref:efflux RND transporter periplasmic adaptor subunit n=1 Tax=Lysobacter sp. S4-A87 TaxID=2925843 RepID=UPI001F539296|nr:efflux RND transporter periplasmic adaptor subunit [Lysobacter sp. S4-A87]UNK50107.1 efflux RND transporter periplasmic adaptor subunit [Lysobacter sp. S4-A87]
MMISYSNFARGAMATAVFTVLAACSNGSAEPTPATVVPEVLTVRARAADSAYDLSLPARAVAGESAQIYARATGFISERRADLGDKVAAGQMLAVIAAPEADQAVREAQAELARARADETLAKVNFDRANVLVGSGAISKELYSDRKANHDVAVAAEAAAEARLTSARERQGFQTVRAPFAGVVVARNIERGDRVVGDSTSATPLFEVSSLDPLRVVIDVPQNVALQIRPGVEADVGFPELPGETFKAQVVRSAQSLSRDSGVMRTELRLPNPDSRIPAGMVGSVRLHLSRPAPATILPLSAVIQRGSGAQVATLKDSSLDYRDVTLGRNLGNEIEVLSGVAANDIVVVAPNALLTPGAQVKAREMTTDKK